MNQDFSVISSTAEIYFILKNDKFTTGVLPADYCIPGNYVKYYVIIFIREML